VKQQEKGKEMEFFLFFSFQDSTVGVKCKKKQQSKFNSESNTFYKITYIISDFFKKTNIYLFLKYYCDIIQ